MEWFESWFDTSYYHTLYKNRDEQEASRFIHNLVDYLQLPKESRVLDLACGKGRHSVTLNQLGFDVLGVDLSSNSIDSAKSYEKDKLSFQVHDMREVILNEKFDAIFNLFTSFGYFDNTSENKKVIQSIHEMLEPKGKVVIDFMNARKVIDRLVTEESKTIDGIQFNIKRRYDGNHIFKNIQFEDQGKSFVYTERVQAIRLNDFENLLVNSNFKILSTFGDFDLAPFNEKDADRLIIIAEKI